MLLVPIVLCRAAIPTIANIVVLVTMSPVWRVASAAKLSALFEKVTIWPLLPSRIGDAPHRDFRLTMERDNSRQQDA
jgi:hypothetical protein